MTPKFKIPDNTKLKSTPVECRVALRLVYYATEGRETAQLRAIAKEIGSTFPEVMRAVESLAKQKFLVLLQPTSVNDFKFLVEPSYRSTFQSSAANYERHLKAKAARKQTLQAPAHLLPITAEQRAPVQALGNELAKKLGVPRIGYKLANCLIRMGEPTVRELVAKAIAQAAESNGKVSSVRTFFELYTEHRDRTIPENSACAAG
jgi:hypothetical protein